MVSFHLIGDIASRRADAARAASQAICVEARVRHSPDIATATGTFVEGAEVLILLEPHADAFQAAFAARDQRGLPRWAVVPPASEDVQHADFLATEWEVPMLVRAIGLATSLFALRRENARLRGDLDTVGRRLTHDLRTPLNSISTANEALADPAIATDAASELHQSISAAVEEAGSLLERVGTVLRASVRPIESQPVDMEEIVWNARQRLDTQLRSGSATILVPENWPAANGSAALLELVWMNLLSNSVHHGGAAPRIQLGWKRVDSRTCFWIRDSGEGVPAAKRARLFHPVDRLNELNAPRGYGLSLVQRLIELHGGSVGYDENPQPGGTFYFTLP